MGVDVRATICLGSVVVVVDTLCSCLVAPPPLWFLAGGWEVVDRPAVVAVATAWP